MRVKTIVPTPFHGDHSDSQPIQQLPNPKQQRNSFASHPKIREISQQDLSLTLQIQENSQKILKLKKEIEDAAYWSPSNMAKIGLWFCAFTMAFSRGLFSPSSGALGAFLLLTPRKHRVRDEKWEELTELFFENAKLEKEAKPYRRNRRRRSEALDTRIRYLAVQELRRQKMMAEHRDVFNETKNFWAFSDWGAFSLTALVWSGDCLLAGAYGGILKKTPQNVQTIMLGAAAAIWIASGILGGALALETVGMRFPKILGETRKEIGEKAWIAFCQAAEEHAALSCELRSLEM